MDTSGGDFSLPGSISEGSVHFATARTLATGFMLQGSKKRILGGRIHPQPGCLLVTSPPGNPPTESGPSARSLSFSPVDPWLFVVGTETGTSERTDFCRLEQRMQGQGLTMVLLGFCPFVSLCFVKVASGIC